jgi:2-dehydro-3-deoxyphosphogalactonate aldolase
MVSVPGVFTPTEAFAAHAAGASALKFFPASVLGADGIKAVSAVLPKDAVLAAVGGVAERQFAEYAAVGVRTFGLGSSLYKPGTSIEGLRANAINAISAYDRAFDTQG